ncbi:hypothetical protein Neosp_005911 [[Neocosmospora] mangrovei]
MRPSALFSVAFATSVLAHGGAHSQKPIVDSNADWMTRHMAEEHHVQGWDPDSFFSLHDFNSDGWWQASELMRMYGLFDDSNKNMEQKNKDEILEILLGLLDSDADFSVSRKEWMDYVGAGKTLPDLGSGPGHHGDDEYEYEIHHWEKYHDENTKLEDLTHPEDIEHFKKHDEMEDAEERLEAMQKLAIVESNIPQKFRRQA